METVESKSEVNTADNEEFTVIPTLARWLVARNGLLDMMQSFSSLAAINIKHFLFV